jgi:hypothetical protein
LEGILRKTKGPGQGVVLSRGVVREETDLFWTLNPERWSHAFFASKMSSYTTNAWPRRGAVRSEWAPSSATVCPETCRVCAIEIRILRSWVDCIGKRPTPSTPSRVCVTRRTVECVGQHVSVGQRAHPGKREGESNRRRLLGWRVPSMVMVMVPSPCRGCLHHSQAESGEQGHTCRRCRTSTKSRRGAVPRANGISLECANVRGGQRSERTQSWMVGGCAGMSRKTNLLCGDLVWQISDEENPVHFGRKPLIAVPQP